MAIRAVRIEEGPDAILEDLLRLRLQGCEILLLGRCSRGHAQCDAHEDYCENVMLDWSDDSDMKLPYGHGEVYEGAAHADVDIASYAMWKWIQGLESWLGWVEHWPLKAMPRVTRRRLQLHNSNLACPSHPALVSVQPGSRSSLGPNAHAQGCDILKQKSCFEELLDTRLDLRMFYQLAGQSSVHRDKPEWRGLKQSRLFRSTRSPRRGEPTNQPRVHLTV